MAGPEAGGTPADAGRTDAQAQELVIKLVRDHATTLLRVARRYSMCADDAQDAYQRGLEILLRHATRLELEGASGWLHTVVKHEALAINRSRRRLVSAEGMDPDAHESLTTASPEEQAIGSDRVARSAEALKRLKPQEAQALWLRALGNSYEQICESTGWTYTKVNRCLAEGRRSFLERYASIERGEECRRWEPVLSAMVDGEASAEQLLEVRPHLRNCVACRALVRAMHESSVQLGVLFPIAGVLSQGHGALDVIPGAAVRAYETIAMYVQERAMTSALRLHALVEATATGKVAAVAASAAAVAGGGMVVDEARRQEPRARALAEHVRPAAVRPAPRLPGAIVAKAPRRRSPSAPAGGIARASRPTRASRPAAEFVPPGSSPSSTAPVATAALVSTPDAAAAAPVSPDASASGGATEFAPAP